MQNGWIALTAALMVLVGLLHSWLGEQKLLRPLFAKCDAALMQPQRKNFLRAAWHLGSATWIALASILLCLSLPRREAQVAAMAIVSLSFALFGALNFLISRGRHPGWVVLLAIAAAAAMASLQASQALAD
ncbi:hypothetical protein BH11PSE11_BH11PSE11_28900 [soil metagenome]